MIKLKKGSIILNKYQLLEEKKTKDNSFLWHVKDIHTQVEEDLEILGNIFLILKKEAINEPYVNFEGLNLITNQTVQLQLFAKRYVILEVLGEGGFSFIWKAIDIQTNGIIAIKIYKDDLDQMSRDEINADWRNNLNHPNLLIPTHLAIYLDKYLYYILPFCPEGGADSELNAKSGDCTKLIGSFEEIEIAKFIQQTSSALVYLHEEKKIVHRDLKVNNFLFKADYQDGKNGLDRTKWNFFVSDIGISKSHNTSLSTRNLQSTREDKATALPYKSPEECYDGRTDLKSDIWTYGVSVYQLLTNRLPYGIYGGATLRKDNNFLPEDLPKEKYSSDLDVILKSCLLLNSDARPTAKELNKWSHNYLINNSWLKPEERQILKKNLMSVKIVKRKPINPFQGITDILWNNRGLSLSIFILSLILLIGYYQFDSLNAFINSFKKGKEDYHHTKQDSITPYDTNQAESLFSGGVDTPIIVDPPIIWDPPPPPPTEEKIVSDPNGQVPIK